MFVDNCVCCDVDLDPHGKRIGSLGLSYSYFYREIDRGLVNRFVI